MPQLNIVGGHVALDLVNTVDPRTPAREPVNHEYLPTPEALLQWAQRVDLLTDTEAKAVATAWAQTDLGCSALHRVLELRESAYDVMLAALGLTDHAEDALNLIRDRWKDAISRSVLRLDANLTDADRLAIGTDPSLLIMDRLANAVVELLRSLDMRQLKACPYDQGGCGFLFLDRSHNSTRRWCSMQDCGARAKARRLTERRRAQRTGHSA